MVVSHFTLAFCIARGCRPCVVYAVIDLGIHFSTVLDQSESTLPMSKAVARIWCIPGTKRSAVEGVQKRALNVATAMSAVTSSSPMLDEPNTPGDLR